MERTNRARETKWQRVVAISVMEINEIIGIATMEGGEKMIARTLPVKIADP